MRKMSSGKDHSQQCGKVSATPGFIIEEGFFDFLYKPHTISGLVVFFGIVVYIAFSCDSSKSTETNVKIGLLAIVAAFLVYCVLQLRDGIMMRPHPALWRAVQGTAILYMCLLVFYFFQSVEDARDWFKYIYPDLGVCEGENCAGAEHDYGASCALYTPDDPESKFRNVRDVVFDLFIVAHTVGYWAKCLMIRDSNLLWFLSIFFEIIEITFQHWMENFKECWWDHIIVDVLVCNALGIWLGMKTVKWLQMKEYNWVGVSKIQSARGRVGRVLAQFSPYSYESFEWNMLSSPKRFFAFLFLCSLVITLDLTAFFLKYILFVPPEATAIHVVRIAIWFFISIPGIREYYQFISDPNCKRFGTNAWIGLAVTVLEVLVVVKYALESKMFTAPFPKIVSIPWTIFFVLFPIWLFLFFSRKKKKGEERKMWTDSLLLNTLFMCSTVIPFTFLFLAGCPHLEWGAEWFNGLFA